MSRVAVVFTGGTISMRHDPVAGGNVPALDGAALLRRLPDAASLPELVPIDLGLTPASHFGFAQLLDIAATVERLLADPSVDGAVLVQGTDTMEETSFLFDLVLESAKPLVVTGAMRASGDPGYDGPANLSAAIRAAASPALRDQGCVVVMAGEIHAADAVIKAHATAIDAFQSLDFGPLGHVDGERVVLARRRVARRHVSASHAVEPIVLITAALGVDGSIVDAARSIGARGLVVEATGSGNTHHGLLEAASKAMGDGIPVVLTTRCPAGRAGTTYAFPGGGATWVRAGALLSGFLGGPKARVVLSLGLGAGLDRDSLARLLADPAEAVTTAAATI